MDATYRDALQGQFGAAIEMLANDIRACPDQLWSNRECGPD